MKRAAGTCNQPGCIGIPVYRGRCPEHAQWNTLTTRQRGRALMARRRRLIRAAFGRCVRCGTAGPLELHHRDGNPGNDEPSNLQPLCPDCHRAAGRQLELGIDSDP